MESLSFKVYFYKTVIYFTDNFRDPQKQYVVRIIRRSFICSGDMNIRICLMKILLSSWECVSPSRNCLGSGPAPRAAPR